MRAVSNGMALLSLHLIRNSERIDNVNNAAKIFFVFKNPPTSYLFK
jgi:hypothetical protein